jgi:hypothetical protein
MGDLDKKASALADRQHGVIGSAQLVGLGGEQHHADTRRADGRWAPNLRGVHRVVGSPSTWRQQLTAAVIAGGAGCAVSHRAALELHGIMSFDEVVEVATPRPRRFRTGADVIIHTSMVLPDEDVTSVDGIPVANVERALLDAGAVVFDKKLRYCVDAALRLGLTDVDKLSSLLAARRKRGRRGVRPLERALCSLPVGGLPESPYERYALEIVREFGLPEPVLQYEVLLPSGRVVRIDLAWPRWWVGAEIDGHGYHSTRNERAYDADRNNELTLIGWNLLRFTTDQIFRAPGQVGNTIWRALQAAEARSRDV